MVTNTRPALELYPKFSKKKRTYDNAYNLRIFYFCLANCTSKLPPQNCLNFIYLQLHTQHFYLKTNHFDTNEIENNKSTTTSKCLDASKPKPN